MERFWFDCLYLGQITGQTSSAWPASIAPRDLYRCYLETCQERHKAPVQVVAAGIGRLLCGGLAKGRPRLNNPERREFYLLPPLAKARADFMAKMNIAELDWPEVAAAADDNVHDFNEAKNRRS